MHHPDCIDVLAQHYPDHLWDAYDDDPPVERCRNCGQLRIAITTEGTRT